MEPQHREALLEFCTGSAAVPACGFAALRGLNGGLRRFELQRVDSAPDNLPTAATCFNTLRLPEYQTEEDLRKKLSDALALSEGFAEAAVAG